MIHSSQKLNSNLAIIKYFTRKSHRVLLEEIVNPLASMLINKKEPSGYFVTFSGDSMNIQVYGSGNFVTSGKLTSPCGLNDVIRIS